MLYEAAFAAITSWFDDERDRLRAVMLVTIVGGFASTIFGPLIAHSVSALGWRTTLVAMALVLLLLVTPIHASLPTATTPSRSVGRHDDVRVLAMVFAVHSFVSTGITVHLVAHPVGGGVSMTDAATMAGALGVAQVGGRLVAGRLRSWKASTRVSLLFGAQGLALSRSAQVPCWPASSSSGSRTAS